MATDLNHVTIIGRLVAEADMKTTPSGTPVCSFSIACNRTYKQGDEKKESCSFFNCTAWGKTADLICQYVKKGDRVAIEGRLQQHTWQDKDTGKNRSAVEIVVSTIQFLQGKSQGQAEEPHHTEVPADQVPPQTDAADIFSDESIPF